MERLSLQCLTSSLALLTYEISTSQRLAGERGAGGKGTSHDSRSARQEYLHLGLTSTGCEVSGVLDFLKDDNKLRMVLEVHLRAKTNTLCRKKLRVQHVQPFREKRGSLITGYKYHCGEKNTRSFVSRRKAHQAKWLLALSQTSTNETPRHRDPHFSTAVLAVLGQAGWWAW